MHEDSDSIFSVTAAIRVERNASCQRANKTDPLCWGWNPNCQECCGSGRNQWQQGLPTAGHSAEFMRRRLSADCVEKPLGIFAEF